MAYHALQSIPALSRGYSSFATDYLVYTLNGNTQMLIWGGLTQPQRLKLPGSY